MSFSKNVSQLKFSGYMLQLNHLLFHKISDEVMSNVNMLCPAVLYRVLGNINSTQVVTVQCHDILCDIVLSQHLLHPDRLRTTATSCYVFSLSSGQRHTVLFLVEPRKKIVPQEEASSRSAFSIISTTSPISITIARQNWFTSMRIQYTIIASSTDILQNSFHLIDVTHFRFSLVSCTYPNSKCNARSAGC